MEDCCTLRPNFGTPLCLPDLGTASRLIFTTSDYKIDLSGESFTANSFILELISNTGDALKIVPFPEVQNFVWTPAESQFEEASNGKKSFLKEGKISITGETWDKDGTAVTVGKMQDMRCSKWRVFIGTDSNNLVGQLKEVLGTIYMEGLPIDEQSIQSLFQFKTDAMTQKNMFSFDLDRNFNVRNLYALNGYTDFSNDELTEAVEIDFNNLPMTVDCKFKKFGAWTTTGGTVQIRDDYSNGLMSPIKSFGNVTGLLLANFRLQNLTDGVDITITSVTEVAEGIYTFVTPATTSGDRLKLSIVNVAPISIPTILNEEIYYAGSYTNVVA
jgi:hypothetical protein